MSKKTINNGYGEWKEVRLGEVAEINMGQSPKSEFYNTQNIGLPFLQGNRTFGIKYPTFDTYCSEPKKIAKKDEILFSVRAPVGAINIANREICIGRGLAALKAKNDNNEYLYFLLRYLKNIIINSESGSVFGAVNKTVLGNIKFLLPPLPEQKAIAEVLSSLDDKIDLLHRQNKTLEHIAESIFKKMFQQPSLNPSQREGSKEAGENWEERALSNYFELLGGFAFKSKDYLTNGRYKVITIKNVQDGYLETKSVSYINDVSEKLKFYQFLEIGDLLISLTGNVGRVCLVDETNCLLNQRVAKISPKNKKWKPFAYFYFRQSDMIERLTYLSKGSAQLNLSPVETLKQKNLLPNDEIIDQFNLIVEPIFDKILKNKTQIRTLEKLRDTLLPKLMSGEIKVLIDE